MSDAQTGGTWTSSNTAVATIGITTGHVTGISAGTSLITYKVIGGSVFTTVTVSALPVAGTISGSSTVCTGATISLTDAASGGVWSSSNSNATVSGGVVTGVLTGTATISYTVTNSCGSAVASKVITISTLSAGTITGLSGVCAGSSIGLSDAVSGGLWNASNVHALVITGTVIGLTAGVDTISYTVTGACGSVAATHTVTVSSSPSAAAITGASLVCVGTNIPLSDASIGGVWSCSNSSATISSGGVVTGVAAGVDTVSYTITNPCGTSAATKIITISSFSAGTITGPGTVCVGATIPLSDAVTGGVWSSGNTNASVSVGGVVTGINGGPDVISYTVTGACGAVTALAGITVMPIPVVGSILGLSSVCVGSSILLTNAALGGVWSSSNADATVVGGNVTGMIAGTDTIGYTISNSCGTAATSVTIAINPLPLVGAISGPDTVCAGSIIMLSDAVSGGTWSVANTNATVSGGIVTGISAGADVVFYAVTNACGTTAAAKAITIQPFPVVASVTGLSSVCIGASIPLSDATPGGTWSSTNSKAIVSGSGIVTGVTAGIDTIKYTVTNTCGAGIVSKIVTISPPTSAGVISGAAGVCLGAYVTLSDAVSGGVWSAYNTHASVTSGGIVAGLTVGVDTIFYTVTSACGTAVAKAVETISTFPVVDAITGTSSVCAGGSVNLSDAASGGVWTSSNPAVATVSGTGMLTGVVAGTAIITYAVTNLTGCTNTATMVATIGAAMPSAIVLPSGKVTICDSSVLVYVVASGTVAYQWMLNGSVIPGATTLSYTASTAGNYSVSLSNGICSETMAGTTVLGKVIPVITFTPPATLSTGSFITYEWYLDGKFIPGATGASVVAAAKGKYTVAVLDENLCHDTSAVYNIGATGIDDISNRDGINVYPNPAAATLNIDAPVKVNIAILSMDGKILLTQKDATNINVSNLANGLYLVMIYDENNLLLKATKFAKE